MQLKTLAVASAALCMPAAALPQAAPVNAEAAFGLITIKSGSQVQNSGVQASLRSLFVNLPQQNATCDAEHNFATFYIKDSKLYLYPRKPTSCGNHDEELQTIFVDRSGMGMGKIGYITGDEGLGRYWETEGWALGDGGLKFKDTGIQACPNSIDGGWSLWLQGVQKPGWNENCTAVNTKPVATENAIGCRYSTEM